MPIYTPQPPTEKQIKREQAAYEIKLNAAGDALQKIKGKHETVDQAIDARIATLKDDLRKMHGTKIQKGLIEEFNESGGQTWGGFEVGSRGLMGKYEDALSPLLEDVKILQESVIRVKGHATLEFTSLDKTGSYEFDVVEVDKRIMGAVKECISSIVNNVDEAEIKLPTKNPDHHNFHKGNEKFNIENLSATFVKPTDESLQILKGMMQENPIPDPSMKPL